MDNGWIKLHRQLIAWEWYEDANAMRVFLHLLLTANHKDKKWQGVTVLAGQTITSSEKLSIPLRLGRQQVRTALKKLESTQEITIKPTNKHTLITLIKWDSYQQSSDIVTSDITNNQPSNNQQLTIKQPTTNHQTTTNKNVNNVNNEKNEENEKNKSRPKNSFLSQPIIDLFNDNLSEHLNAATPSDTLKSQLKARSKEYSYTLENWAVYFESILDMPFMLGQVTDFKTTLLWLTGKKNMAKVLSGQYIENKVITIGNRVVVQKEQEDF